MSELIQPIKEMIIRRLKLEDLQPSDIEDDAPLFGQGLGLDSIDALELVLGIEQEFGVKIADEAAGLQAFRSVRSLAGFIEAHRSA